MRDDEIRNRLVESNPWWRATSKDQALNWVATDPVLRARAPFDLGYRPDLLDDVATGPIDDKLIVLRGPRRVGKSVLLKDTVSALCSRADVDVRQIIYLPVDTMRANDLSLVVALGRDLTRSIDPQARVWMLDEITSVPEWTGTLKYLRDNTSFGEDTVICTGSSWDQAANVGRDLLAGRAGRNSTRRLRMLLPMQFRDVVIATGRQLPLPAVTDPWDLQGEDARRYGGVMEIYANDLDLAWQSYLTSGGFPRAVAEHQSQGHVSDAFVGDLLAWLHRNVDPDVAEDSLSLLLDALARRSTSPMNRTSVAEELGYSNRQSFDLRLQRLVSCLGAIWCHQINDSGRRVSGAQSKLYLIDPLVASLGGLSRSGLQPPDFTRLTENAVGIAMARAIDFAQPGRWLAQDTIGYLRTGQGSEIDLSPVSVPAGSGPQLTTPLESKWVSQGWRTEARTLEAKFDRGILATRNIFDTSTSVWALPAPVIALLLG